MSFSNFARSVSYSFTRLKENVLGVSFIYFASGTFQVGFGVNFAFMVFISIEYPVFSLAILEIPFLGVFFKKAVLSVNFLCFYILCVLSFPIFWSIYLYIAFSYLVAFQRVIVGCWVVDVLLFLSCFYN